MKVFIFCRFGKKLLALIAAAFIVMPLCFAQEEKKSSWNFDIGVGVTSSFKFLNTGNKNSNGNSYQLDAFCRGYFDNGFSLFAEGSVGVYVSSGLKLGDSAGLFFNPLFLFGAGYDFLNKNQKNNLVLSAVIGLDFICYDDEKSAGLETYKYENFITNFVWGADLLYCHSFKNGVSFYAGCNVLFGVGVLTIRGTKTDRFGTESTLSTDYDSVSQFSFQPKLGFLYRF